MTEMASLRLWIDDERSPLTEFNKNAQSSAQAIDILSRAKQAGEHFELASFDHDANGAWSDETFRPVLEWMIDNEYWPETIRFHTANPDGHKYLRERARGFGPTEMEVDETDPWNRRVFDTKPMIPWVYELLSRGSYHA